ncbi:MAG: cysteine hydrolase, partial [Erysipelotrichaceae bacterium]|nr:cysteine hydrolase [Erysipelotrichaceae bacterium]
MKALCIIDVQNAMIQGNNPVYRSNEVLHNIKELIDKARKQLVPIIYVQHNEEGSEFQKGLDSWEIVDMIKPHKDDPIVHKTYSDSFKDTNLKEILDQYNINELIVVGMQTDYCVNATSLRANELDYDVTIVSDAHSTFDDEISAKQ